MEVNKITNFEFKMLGKGYKPRSIENTNKINWSNIHTQNDLEKHINEMKIDIKLIKELN